MPTQNISAISLDELAITLDAYAGPPQPRSQAEHRRLRPWRLAWVVAALALMFAGAAYAAGFNPFPGISSADRPATSNDSLPASLADTSNLNAWLESRGLGDLLPDSARLVSELPDGLRLYVIATTTGELCVDNVASPAGAIFCGDQLSRSSPIVITGWAGPAIPPVHYGLALDGVTALSFTAGGVETTVPVKDNVWAYEGQADITSVTVHWADGSTQTINYPG